MVYYFQSSAAPGAKIYMGKEKYENEELIKHGWEEDVWFHVDKLSSAHVYLRLEEGQTWDSIPQDLLTDLAQLTKANSIEGNKKNNLVIIYTPWSNLKKTGDMAVGQVSFHNPRLVKRCHVETRTNEIINRLNKTRVEKQPDLYAEKADHQRELNRKARAIQQAKRKEEECIRQEYQQKKEMKNYAGMFDETEIMQNSNRNATEDLEEDFM
ncbi:hypothetical protein IWQ61_004702 [Dispira simplex]|nr:hypothetical protein IWQ61_004702 [Dispira simplex]